LSSRGLRKLGRSGLQVSPLCLGAMNFGNEQFGCDEETSIGIIKAYLDAGHNFIDTANVYSGTKSETIVGKAVKGRRDSVVIATKAASALGPGPFESGTSR
jgi:aryl-alcohol dehydrogenase-like predicted oxidoreductase